MARLGPGDIVEEFLRKIGSAIDVVDFSRISEVNKPREYGTPRFNMKYRDLSFISSEP